MPFRSVKDCRVGHGKCPPRNDTTDRFCWKTERSISSTMRSDTAQKMTAQNEKRPFSKLKRSNSVSLRGAQRRGNLKVVGTASRDEARARRTITPKNFSIRPAGTPHRRFSQSAISRGRKPAFHMRSIFHTIEDRISLRSQRPRTPCPAKIDARSARDRASRANCRIFGYSACGPAETSALPASLPSYFLKFFTKRAARSFAFASHSDGSA